MDRPGLNASTPLRPLPGRHDITQRAKVARGHLSSQRAPFGDLFNRDTAGLPQNEESISDCTSNPSVLLSGTNDYRGLLDPAGDFTGWHLSVDGGRTVADEGLLPPVQAADWPRRPQTDDLARDVRSASPSSHVLVR